MKKTLKFVWTMVCVLIAAAVMSGLISTDVFRAAADGSVTVSARSNLAGNQIKAGSSSEIVVTIVASEYPSYFFGLQTELTYDPGAFVYTGHDFSSGDMPANPGNTVSLKNGIEGTVKFMVTDDTMSQISSPEVEVVKLKFALAPGAHPGEYEFSFAGDATIPLCYNAGGMISLTTVINNLTISVTSGSQDNSITSLEVDGQPVTADGTVYTYIETEYTAATAMVKIDVADGATLKIDGVAATPGEEQTVQLPAGADTSLAITVTAEAGAEQGYTLIIKRSLPSDAVDITALTVNGKTVTRSGDTYSYSIPYTENSAEITATASRYATMTFDGQPWGGLAKTISVPTVGDVIKQIVVTAQDGVTRATYNVKITRNPPQTDSGIKSLEVNGSTVLPSGLIYTAATVAYHDLNATVSVTINPTASMTINGDIATSGAKVVVDLKARQETSITVIVTAEDGITSTRYTIIVPRAQADSSRNIISLSVGGAAVQPEGTIYTAAKVAYGDAATKVTVVIPQTATMTLRGVTVISGVEHSLNLTTGGETVVAIVVTAQNGDTGEYTLIIPRDSGSSDKELTRLTVNGETLAPAGGVYTMSVENHIDTVIVSAAASPLATMSFAGEVWSGIDKTLNIKEGVNQYSIVVKAQDGTSVRFTLVVVRARLAASSNSNIAQIIIPNTNMNFDPAVTSYTVEIAPYADSAEIYAWAENEYATIEGLDGNAVAVGPGEEKTVSVYAVAEDGTEGTKYSIKLKRVAESEIKLSNLILGEVGGTGGSGKYEISLPTDTGKREFTVTVPGALQTIKIDALIPYDGYAIEGNGIHALKNYGTDNPNYINLRVVEKPAVAQAISQSSATSGKLIAEYNITVIRETANGVSPGNITDQLRTYKGWMIALAIISPLLLLALLVAVFLILFLRKDKKAVPAAPAPEPPTEPAAAPTPPPAPSEPVQEKYIYRPLPLPYMQKIISSQYEQTQAKHTPPAEPLTYPAPPASTTDPDQTGNDTEQPPKQKRRKKG